MAKPSGRIVLTVSGAIATQNGDGEAAFDRAMLESLDWREIETYTSFTKGKQTFAGPTLASLIEAVKASGDTVRATAINDYAVEFPVSDAAEHDVILAMDHNGRPMRVRDKGPIWIVYPLGEDASNQMTFDAQMIWQLDRIFIK
ncbi:MAG: molybdopterin-dependent oxidoreductase [Aliishimia sp.]